MISYYCIVRYVPNPLIEEFVNVGVVTFGEGQVYVRFARDLQRAQQFGGRDVGFIREAETWLTAVAKAQLARETRLGASLLRPLAEEWANTIQLSRPRAAVLDPRELLDEVAKEYLQEREASNET